MESHLQYVVVAYGFCGLVLSLMALITLWQWKTVRKHFKK